MTREEATAWLESALLTCSKGTKHMWAVERIATVFPQPTQPPFEKSDGVTAVCVECGFRVTGYREPGR